MCVSLKKVPISNIIQNNLFLNPYNRMKSKILKICVYLENAYFYSKIKAVQTIIKGFGKGNCVQWWVDVGSRPRVPSHTSATGGVRPQK